MFKQIKEFLSSTSWQINLIFLILAIASIIITIITYSRSKKKKKAAQIKRNFALISKTISAIPGLEITMGEEQINNLTLTYLAIWNNGSDILNYEDFAHSDPLKITVKDPYKIFMFEVDFIKDKCNNLLVKSSEDRRAILISFEYLNKYDGFVLKIYHNGLKEEDVEVHGTIKGFGKIPNGKIEDNKIVFKFWDILIGKLDDYYEDNNKPPAINLLIKLLVILTIPIIIPLILIDKIQSYLNIIPKEYKLLKENDS